MGIWKQSLKIMEYHPMTHDKANIVEEEWTLLEQKNSFNV